MSRKVIPPGALWYRSLVPDWAYLVLGGVALGLPNLVFSGFLFYDPLHLLKWMVTMVPVALLSVWCGLSIARRRWEDTGFRVDPLGALLLCLILWASLQPLLGGIKSMPTFVREWFAFSGLVAFYLVTYNVFRGGAASGLHLARGGERGDKRSVRRGPDPDVRDPRAVHIERPG